MSCGFGKLWLFCSAIVLLSVACMPGGQRTDDSILRPTDGVYPAAMEFAHFLKERDITVRSTHRSKLESMFPGVTAAFFRTDRGSVQVIFFPEPQGAEGVQIEEHQKEGRFIYSIRQHQGSTPVVVDSSLPQVYIRHNRWLIVTREKDLAYTIQDALGKR